MFSSFVFSINTLIIIINLVYQVSKWHGYYRLLGMSRNPYGLTSLIKLYYLPVTEFPFFGEEGLPLPQIRSL